MREAEVRAGAIKLTDGSVALITAEIKSASAKIDDKKTSAPERKKLIKKLDSTLDNLNKKSVAIIQEKMQSHAQAINKAEKDAKLAVAKAKKAEPKLGKMQCIKLAKHALDSAKTIGKALLELSKARKSLALAGANFENESLRIKSELESGTPPETIQKQRQALAMGVAAQFKTHMETVAKHCATLLGHVEGMLDIQSYIDKDAAQKHEKVLLLQQELGKIGATARKLQPILKAFGPFHGVMIKKVLNIANGNQDPVKNLALEIEDKLELNDFKKLFGNIKSAETLIKEIKKL